MIISILSILLIIIFTLIVIMRFKNNRFYIFDLPLLLICFSLFDFYLPIFSWSFNGAPEYFGYVSNNEDLLISLIYYTLFYSIMLLPLLLVKNNGLFKICIKYNYSRVFFSGIILLTFTLLGLFQIIFENGGFVSWLYNMSYNRFEGGLSGKSDFGFLQILPFRSCFNVVVFIAFCHRKIVENKYKLVFTYLFPIIGFILSFLTFFRGSILMFFLGLLFSELVRFYSLTDYKISLKSFQKKIILGFSFSILLFYIYGKVRTLVTLNTLDNLDESSISNTQLLKGHGAQGLIHIMKNYPSNYDFFYGKTYFDMLLLPVPRTFYSAKPIWYGIDDITRTMGWPNSSQSAVTIPGEAYANFGFFGLLIAIFWALIFFNLITIANRFKSFYWLIPSVYLYMISTSNWMAFTGFFNQLILFIMTSFIILYIRKGAIYL